MELTPFNIYLWQQVDTIFSALKITCMFIVPVLVISWGLYADNVLKSKVLPMVTSFVAPFVFVVTALFPSSKTLAMMYVLPEIAQSKLIQEDAPEIYEMSVDALKKWIESNATKE